MAQRGTTSQSRYQVKKCRDREQGKMCTALRERRSVIGLPLDDTGLSNESGRGGSTPERVRGSSRSSSSHSAAVFFGEPMERSVVPPRSIPSKDMAPAPSEVTLFLGPGNSVPNSSTCGVKKQLLSDPATLPGPRWVGGPRLGGRGWFSSWTCTAMNTNSHGQPLLAHQALKATT